MHTFFKKVIEEKMLSYEMCIYMSKYDMWFECESMQCAKWKQMVPLTFLYNFIKITNNK